MKSSPKWNNEGKAREEGNFEEYSGSALCETLPKRLLAVSIIGFVKILSGRNLSGKVPARKGR
jgi:hypothetical protein